MNFNVGDKVAFRIMPDSEEIIGEVESLDSSFTSTRFPKGWIKVRENHECAWTAGLHLNIRHVHEF